jgi:hypothetical protein
LWGWENGCTYGVLELAHKYGLHDYYESRKFVKVHIRFVILVAYVRLSESLGAKSETAKLGIEQWKSVKGASFGETKNPSTLSVNGG